MSRMKGKHRITTESIYGSILLLPAVLLIIFFLLLPAVITVILSVTSGKGFKIGSFIGLENYIKLFQDDNFFSFNGLKSSGAVVTSVQWLLIGVPLVIVLGFIIALLTKQYKRKRLLRSIFFIPLVISGTSTAIIWMFMYTPNPNVGFLSALRGTAFSWLGNPDTVNFALIFTWVWGQLGMALIILSAALERIPEELVEAAKIDGANSVNIFFHVTLPSIRAQFSFLVVTEFVQVLKVFDIVFVLTDGGPANTSQTIALMFYKQTFVFSNPHYGAAIVTVMALFIVLVYAVSNALTKERD